MEVVHGGERRELAVAEAMTAVMMQGQLTVAALHTGTAALEQIGAFGGHLFEALAVPGRERVQWVIGLAQRFEQPHTQCPPLVTEFGTGTARSHALQVQGRNELLDERRLQGGRQIEGLDLGLQGRKEKGDGGKQLSGQALRLGEALAGARRQIGGGGKALQLHPNVREARREALDGLRLPGLQIIGVIQGPEFTDQFTGLALTRLRAVVLGFGLDPVGQGRLNAGRDRGRATAGMGRGVLVRRLGRPRGLPVRPGGW